MRQTGLRHLWGDSSFHLCKDPPSQGIHPDTLEESIGGPCWSSIRYLHHSSCVSLQIAHPACVKHAGNLSTSCKKSAESSDLSAWKAGHAQNRCFLESLSPRNLRKSLPVSLKWHKTSLVKAAPFNALRNKPSSCNGSIERNLRALMGPACDRP